jgi:hypothetical protein
MGVKKLLSPMTNEEVHHKSKKIVLGHLRRMSNFSVNSFPCYGRRQFFNSHDRLPRLSQKSKNFPVTSNQDVKFFRHNFSR